METRAKLRILADAAKYDASCASSGSKRARSGTQQLGDTNGMGICHSYTPDGRCVSLLKVLYTNHCIYDCRYCINRSSSDTPRARFEPRELANLAYELYKRNYIEGLFLSSGVLKDPDTTMHQLIRVVEILRDDLGFNGYIHLKAVPGASAELIEKAGLLVDRMSANIEVPEQAHLERLAPGKRHDEIEASMGEIQTLETGHKELRPTIGPRAAEPPRFLPAGQSTQMIVGATSSSDRAILTKSENLYRRFRLRRVYYSAFSPIQKADSSLPVAAPPLIREHRLYQADWLLRFYGYSATELFNAVGDDLPLSRDPKLAFALANRALFPVDVNTAPRERLLRVPGVGVRSADAIVLARRQRRLRLEDLARLKVNLRKARYFLIAADDNPWVARLDGEKLDTHPDFNPPQQLELFSARQASVSGQL